MCVCVWKCVSVGVMWGIGVNAKTGTWGWISWDGEVRARCGKVSTAVN